MFLQVAKAGSSFWRQILGSKYSAFLNHENYNQSRDAWNSNLRVTFVRHPLYRLFSAYNDKVVGMETYYMKKLKTKIRQTKLYFRDRYQYRACFNNTTFEQFVVMVIQQIREDPYDVDVHWSPFYGLCKTCKMKYDIIGKIETFNDDLDLVAFKLNKQNKSFMVTKEDIDNNYLNDKCRQMSERDIYPLHRTHSHRCNHVDIVLKSKLKSLWNKGFTEEFGYTMTAFRELPRDKWKEKCFELGWAILGDPEKMKKAKGTSKNVANRELQGLSEKVKNDLIEVFKPDLDMFGYDPNLPFVQIKSNVNHYIISKTL